MAFSEFKLTTKGLALMRKVIAGEESLSLTSFHIGSGTLKDTDIPNLQSLNHDEASFAFAGIADLSDGSGVKIDVIISNYQNAADYQWKESAIYANDPATGDFVFAASYDTGDGMKIPKYDGNYPVSITEDIIIAVANASQITITTNKDQFVTESAVETLVSEYVRNYMKSYKAVIAQATAPNDTTVVWVDTGNGSVAKYYDTTKSAWTTIKSVWG